MSHFSGIFPRLFTGKAGSKGMPTVSLIVRKQCALVGRSMHARVILRLNVLIQSASTVFQQPRTALVYRGQCRGGGRLAGAGQVCASVRRGLGRHHEPTDFCLSTQCGLFPITGVRRTVRMTCPNGRCKCSGVHSAVIPKQWVRNDGGKPAPRGGRKES